AIPDDMPWRYTDTDLRDDFPTRYNEGVVARLAEFIVPLRSPPLHLLYVCGLTTAYRHPELAYDIKDRDGNVLTMDAFLKIPVWTGTVKNLEKPNSKIAAAREKNEAKALAKLQAKHAGEGASEALRKKRKAHSNQAPGNSDSEKTLSPTPLHQAALRNKEEPATAATVRTIKGATVGM
ncbi:hypothetical protein Tco_1339048, partial [Tanacetum coccineum]